MTSSNGTRPPIHVVNYGKSGDGKSTFLSTFPKPLLVLLHDPLGKEGPYRRYPFPFREGEQRVVQEDRDALGTPRLWNQSPTDPKDYLCVEFYNDLDPFSGCYDRFSSRLWKSDFVAEGWQSVGIDSITFLALMARKYNQYVTNPRSKESRQWFAGATDALEEALMVRLSVIRCNFVILCHVEEDRDETTGGFVFNPSAPGRLSKNIPAAFGEFYHQYIQRNEKGEKMYLVQTAGDGRFNASTQISAPDPSWAHYEALWSNWR